MNIARGDIWLVNLDPTIADEIRKTRPAVVVSHDAVGVLALRVVVPVTAWQDRFSHWDWMVRLDSTAANGLDNASAVDTFQVRSISCQRFVRRFGQLSDEEMNRICEALRLVLEL